MGDFRPIACCNVFYKCILIKKCVIQVCITKILANRMLRCLEGLISLNQSAFIPHWSIAEIILLAQEVVKNYHKRESFPSCTIKADLMDAYDSVDWKFLMYCLYSLGFSEKVSGFVWECISTIKFFLCT
jgi:hypothetical protein